MAASVTITSVEWRQGGFGLHGTVNGQAIDTYPAAGGSFTALPTAVAQRQWVAQQLASAASSYPVASSLPLTIGASGPLVL